VTLVVHIPELPHVRTLAIGAGGFAFGFLLARWPWPWRPMHEALERWRFRRRFPIGCRVSINGRCCEKQHKGKTVTVRRYQFDCDRPEVRFDMGADEPWGCCGAGMDRVR
jgi:hypothetical protein